MNRLTVLVSCVGALGLGGPAVAEDEHGHDEHGSELVELGEEELAEFEIEVATAGPGTIEIHVTIPGEVRPNEDRLAHIVPRYSGIVTEVRVNIGDVVQKGQTLAIVESDESLAPFEVKTLIAGTVIEKHIALGEAVSRDRDTFVIADLSTVWVDLTVYQRDLTRIRKGQPARIFVGHEPSPDLGTISYVTPVVDETTRTATARIVLQNPDGRWRPGMFVRGKVLVKRTLASVAVPRTALHTYEGLPVVFIETPEGFTPRGVHVGDSGAEIVEIVEGLAPGERYVIHGGFTVKADLGKASFGDGHGH